MNAGEKRINSIEGLRGCAAIIVAYFYHYKNEFGGNIPTPDILQNDKIIWLYQRLFCQGYLGVELFFLISGFFMAKRYSEKIPFSTISIHENMKKKFLKIMPIFIITNIVTLILQWFNILTTGNSYIVGNNTLSALFLSFCGIQYLGLGLNTPGWFLTVLFLCYFIFYVYLKKAKTKVHFLYFVFFTMCLGVVFLVNPLDFILLRKDIARGLFSFFLGVLSFFGVEKYVEKSKKTGIICLSIFSIILWLFSLYYNLGGEIHISFTFFVAIPLIILVVYFKPINWLLSLKVFQYIGAVSLSIYLWNFPIDAVFDIVNRYLGIFQYNSCKFFVFHLIISLLISIGMTKGKFLIHLY